MNLSARKFCGITVTAAAMAAAVVGFAAQNKTPAQAGTALPPCKAPAGQHCLAIDNRSDHAPGYKLNSFRSPDGRCMPYKSGWGPGDIVGWPDVFVNDTILDPGNPALKAYSDTKCGNEVPNVPITGLTLAGKPAIRDGYVTIAAGPRFVRFSNRTSAYVIKWCVSARDANNNEIAGDCDRVGSRGTSTFWVPDNVVRLYYSAYEGSGLGPDTGWVSLDSGRDNCWRAAETELHEATDKPCMWWE